MIVSSGFELGQGWQHFPNPGHYTADFIPEPANENNGHSLSLRGQRLLGERLAQLCTGYGCAERLPCDQRRTACQKNNVPYGISEHDA